MARDGACSEYASVAECVLQLGTHCIDGFICALRVAQVDLSAIEGGGVWQGENECDDGATQLESF
jgi:hypothetical protein